MPTISLGDLLDKPIYATKTMSSYIMSKDPNKPGSVLIDKNGNVIPKKYLTYKKGDLIGTLESYTTKPFFSGMETKLLLWFRPNFGVNGFAVKAEDVFTMLSNKDIAQQVIKEQEAAESANKPLLQQYLDKYLPYVVGGVVIWIALPTIVNTARSSKMGAMNNKKNVALVLAAIALLAWKRKSKNKIILSPVQDVTDWSNTEGYNTTTILPLRNEQPILYSSYNSVNGINSKQTTTPKIC